MTNKKQAIIGPLILAPNFKDDSRKVLAKDDPLEKFGKHVSVHVSLTNLIEFHQICPDRMRDSSYF